MIESDHKPLIPLLGTKRLDSLPPRVLHFGLRMARYVYSIIHVPESSYTLQTSYPEHLYILSTASLSREK